jgi:hypothetical protein
MATAPTQWRAKSKVHSMSQKWDDQEGTPASIRRVHDFGGQGTEWLLAMQVSIHKTMVRPSFPKRTEARVGVRPERSQ